MILLAAATGAIHIYIGVVNGRPEFLVLGSILLAGLFVFFTDAFAPVLYLVGAIYVGVLLSVWLFEGAHVDGIVILDKLVQLCLIVVFLVLLYREEFGSTTSGRVR